MAGMAEVIFLERDLSFYYGLLEKGIVCMAGVMERGTVGEDILVGSIPDYEEQCGSLLEEYDFPLIVQMALQRGSKLRLSRVVGPSATTAYASADDRAGSASSARLVGTLAGPWTIGASNKTLSIKVDGGDATLVTLLEGTRNARQVANDINLAVTGAVAAATPTGCVAIKSSTTGGSSSIEVEASSTADETLGLANVAVTGAAAGVAAPSLKFWALNEGDWGNDVVTTVSAATLYPQDEFKVAVHYKRNSHMDELFDNCSMDETKANYVCRKINDISMLIRVEDKRTAQSPAAPLDMPVAAEYDFDHGDADLSNVGPTDYVGTAVNLRGLHAFDNVTDSISVMAPEACKLSEANSIAVVCEGDAYAQNRKDMAFYWCIPPDKTPAQAITYRDKTGVDSSYAMCYFDELVVLDPLSGVPNKQVINLGGVAGVLAYTDNEYAEFYPPAGYVRGRIPGAQGVRYNVGSPGKKAQGDALYDATINPIVCFPGESPTVWGNRTCQRMDSALSFIHIRRLMLVLRKMFLTANRVYLFQHNNPVTWRKIYRQIDPLLRDFKSLGALYSYEIQCDQDKARIEDAVLNTPTRVDRGEFRCRIFLKPTRDIEKFYCEAVLTQTSADFQEYMTGGQL